MKKGRWTHVGHKNVFPMKLALIFLLGKYAEKGIGLYLFYLLAYRHSRLLICILS